MRYALSIKVITQYSSANKANKYSHLSHSRRTIVSFKTKILRIIQFSLREFGQENSRIAIKVLEALEREHIREEEKWLRINGRNWKISR
jgi:hypothetical protein